jgi:hypothetical protein
MDTIANIGPHKGLLNNAKISVGDDGTPYVTYTKYADSGRNGVYFAKPEGAAWKSVLLADSDKLTPIKGAGTLRGLPRFSAVRFVKDAAIVNVHFPGQRRFSVHLKLRPSSHDVAVRHFKGIKTNPVFSSVLSRLNRPTVITSYPKGKDVQIRFGWIGQAFNRKTALRCRRDASPPQCSPPPSPLMLQDSTP